MSSEFWAVLSQAAVQIIREPRGMYRVAPTGRASASGRRSWARRAGFARPAGCDHFVLKRRTTQVHVWAHLEEEDVGRQSADLREGSGGLVVRRVGRNGKSNVVGRLGLQRIRRWGRHHVEPQLGLVGLSEPTLI